MVNTECPYLQNISVINWDTLESSEGVTSEDGESDFAETLWNKQYRSYMCIIKEI